MSTALPADWANALADELVSDRFAALQDWLRRERAEHTVFPPHDRVFAALQRTPLASVRVVILGQDPYHDDGQAHGLAFSVPEGVKRPPSLRNIFRELEDDLGLVNDGGSLEAWADHGVLLLNTVLTVRAHEPASHRGQGWEEFTDAVIRAVNEQPERVVFLLWGNHARSKRPLVDAGRHAVIESAHPSPLSARRGFFGSRPFSKANALLEQAGRDPVDWRIAAARAEAQP